MTATEIGDGRALGVDPLGIRDGERVLLAEAKRLAVLLDPPTQDLVLEALGAADPPQHAKAGPKPQVQVQSKEAPTEGRRRQQQQPTSSGGKGQRITSKQTTTRSHQRTKGR